MNHAVKMLEINELHESKNNPRKHFNQKEIDELAQSIKDRGVMNPLLVRPVDGGTEILAGAKRYRASKKAGLKQVPCFVRTDLDDTAALELMAIDNVQRSSVHPLDEADSYKSLLKQAKYTVSELARKLALEESHIYRRLKLCELIEPLRKMYFDYLLTIKHANLLARLTETQQKEMTKWLKSDGDGVPSPAAMKQEIERSWYLSLEKAAFDTNDATLVPKAGACTNCPKRSGANVLLFDDVPAGDTCTDQACYMEKERAFVKIQVGTHKDAKLLTLANYIPYGTKPKGLTEWVEVKKKCDSTVEGVVVEVLGMRRDNDEYRAPGRVLSVCVDAKCKTHHGSNHSSSSHIPRGRA